MRKKRKKKSNVDVDTDPLESNSKGVKANGKRVSFA